MVTQITLRPWQIKGIELSRIHSKYGMFNEKGMGKSLMAVVIANEKISCGGKVLITTKRDLIQLSWQEEMRYFPNLHYADLNGNHLEIAVKRRLLDNVVNLFFINHEMFRLYYNDICYGITTLIIDESSILKNPNSQTTKTYLEANEKYKFDNIYLLSGRPAPNGEYEYFSQIQLLDPSLFGVEYNKFEKKYFYRSVKTNYKRILKSSLKNEFVDKLRSVSFFVGNEDVERLTGKQVVKKISDNRYFDLTYEQLILYNEYLNPTIKFIKDHNRLPAIGKLVKCIEIFCGFLKDTETGNIKTFDTILYDEMYKVLMENPQDQFIICCSFDYEQLYVVNYLKQKDHSFAVISGKHSKNERKNSLVAFKNNYVQYLIAKTKVIKFGHNLQNCHRMIHTSHDLSYEDYDQSSGRIHRGLSQEKDCYYSSILAKGTIAEVIYEALQNKKDVAIELLNHLKQKI